MELVLQESLRNGVTLERIQEYYGVYSKRHPKYSNLVQFGYDQIESAKDKFNPHVIESRGLILDEANNWNVVAYPFNRFFNYGEGVNQHDIHWGTARVQEKVDGSLMIMYYYDDQWQVATRGSINASGNVGDNSFTFAELFWKIFTKQFDFGVINDLNRTRTYMFELVSKYNRVVCDHSENEGELILIGMRSNIFFDEFWVSEYPELNPVKEFSLATFDDVIKAAEALNPMQQEGFVVFDGVNRQKIKSPKYVLIHHLQDGFGPRRIVELIKLGEISEVLSYYPEYMKLYDDIENRINLLATESDADYILLNRTPLSRKEFALLAIKTINPGAMFALLDKKVNNSKEFILRLPAERILQMIGVKNVESGTGKEA